VIFKLASLAIARQFSRVESGRKGSEDEITDQITSIDRSVGKGFSAPQSDRGHKPRAKNCPVINIDILISDPGKTDCSHLSGEITMLFRLAFSI
jgi:hypothetical protein